MFGITAIGAASAGYFLSLGGLGLFAIATLILRAAITDYRLPLLIILIAWVIALISLLLGLGAMVFGEIGQLNLRRSIVSILVSAGIFLPILIAGRAIAGLPMINDIMTDIANPPEFRMVSTQRKPFDNSLELSQARLDYHQKHYGDMQPLFLTGKPETHFDKIVSLVESKGWLLVASDKDRLVVEATDATPFFGFKDDVVIRLSENNDQTRIDMRSASRQGRHDFRVNAERIEAFLSDLKTAP